MIKIYPGYLSFFVLGLAMLFFVFSCKKDSKTVTPTGPQPIATLGLYELSNSNNTARRIYLPITQVGTQTGSWYSVFDTGSSGMTIDAAGILPPAMITDNGITVAGDSVTVNGITVTTQEATLSYGDATSEIQEYGNLAYAPVTIGDKNGNYNIKRIPIFLYYKVVNLTTGVKQPAHSNDVFGVGPGVNFGSLSISSPLSYLSAAGVTPGFKLGTLNPNSFSVNATYVSKLLTIGLVPDDLTTASGFVLHPLSYSPVGGYSPDIPASISYNGITEQGTLLFDTGTPSFSIIENNAAPKTETILPASTKVSITTNQGFTYSYTTTSTLNMTQVANPNLTLDPRTIFSIDFFISNEYLMDYSGHRIGLKNN
jgi:hypothetical protein